MRHDNQKIPHTDDWNNYHHLELPFGALPAATGQWKMKVRRNSTTIDDFKSLPTEDLVDIFLLIHFNLSTP